MTDPKPERAEPLTPEQAAELRAEGEALSAEIARHTAPMKRGPFGPGEGESRPARCGCGKEIPSGATSCPCGVRTGDLYWNGR